MPWKETSAMDQRIQLIADWLSGDYTKTELSRIYGISRPTADKWIERYAKGGPDDEEVWETRNSEEVGTLELALHPNWFKLYPLHIHNDFIVWLRAEYVRLRAELLEDERSWHDKYQHHRWEEFFKKAETDHSQL